MYNSSKKSISKIISIFLISSILICAYSICSSAETGNMDITTFDMPFYAEYYDTGSSSWVSLDSTKTLVTFNNASSVRYDVPRITEGVANVRYCNIYQINTLKANHEYNLKFSYAFNMPNQGGLNVYLQILNGSGTVIDVQTIFTSPALPAGGASWQPCDVSFIPDLSNVSSGYSMRLMFEFHQNWNTYPFQAWLSSTIYFNDNDDDSAWYEQIIQWIQNVATSISNGVSNLVNSISTLGSNIGTWFTNLGNNISTWLTTLGNNISTWLTAVKDGIVNKLQSVQTAITNAIDGIQQWFVNLGNRIGDFFTMLKNYILYFQHPVTLNADGVPVDANGNPVYTNPFEDTLQSVSDTLDDWFDSLDDFILTIQSVNVQITGYLQTFTSIFNRFNAGVPIIGVIITLALIVIVIKKIMGR